MAKNWGKNGENGEFSTKIYHIESSGRFFSYNLVKIKSITSNTGIQIFTKSHISTNYDVLIG